MAQALRPEVHPRALSQQPAVDPRHRIRAYQIRLRRGRRIAGADPRRQAARACGFVAAAPAGASHRSRRSPSRHIGPATRSWPGTCWWRAPGRQDADRRAAQRRDEADHGGARDAAAAYFQHGADPCSVRRHDCAETDQVHQVRDSPSGGRCSTHDRAGRDAVGTCAHARPALLDRIDDRAHCSCSRCRPLAPAQLAARAQQFPATARRSAIKDVDGDHDRQPRPQPGSGRRWLARLAGRRQRSAVAIGRRDALPVLRPELPVLPRGGGATWTS